jgi:pyruvate formate-lyase activating enzyme-like uncharacterized protein
MLELELADEQAARANAERDSLLASLDGAGAVHGAGGSRICHGDLSPGCLSCERGAWSCLFLNALCTANCFFCPQDRARHEERPPIAEGLVFDVPGTYLDYLERFHFAGVAFSGGEALLALDALLSLVAGARQRLGDGAHVWLYTNGDLLDARKLRALRAAGLDEIRFNVAARGYSLEPVALARESIGRVTVEIPAIPEDEERVWACAREMDAIGVDHLNLHQLFATEHNYAALAGRGYTPLAAEARRDPPVLESELAALRLVRRALESDLGVAVNYCSHVYKARVHPPAGRRRAATEAKRAWERVTGAGYLSHVSLGGPAEALREIADDLQRGGAAEGSWSLGEGGRALFFLPSLLGRVGSPRAGCEVALCYDQAAMGSRRRLEAGGFEVVSEIELGRGARVCVGRRQAARFQRQSPADVQALLAPAEGGAGGEDGSANPFERVGAGLPEIAGFQSLWSAWRGRLLGGS